MKRSYIVILIIIMLIVVCGCGGIETQGTGYPTAAATTSTVNSTTVTHGTTTETPTAATTQPMTEPTSEPTESTGTQIGLYTLEECKQLQGLFVRYEDGSFDRYYAGGFRTRSGRWQEDEKLYISRYNVMSNPVVTPDTQLVLFWDEQPQWNLVYSVLFEGYTIPYYSEEYGKQGAIVVGSGVEIDATMGYRVDVGGDNYEILYLAKTRDGDMFGAPVKFEEDIPSVDVSGFYTFEPGAEVTLRVAEGTEVTEVKTAADMAYYVYGKLYAADGYYYERSVDSYLSVDGYIEFDFSKHPSGQYVWIIESDGRYYGTVIQINND